ncbi:MAG: helix-turn-helix transcriptional regulator [Eubacterium limosum]|nr:helix-turn-helix transcriptional regulator [Eubacterium limosum]
MGFGENLRQLRRERRLSQEELAERLMVSRQAVSKWEQGVSQS